MELFVNNNSTTTLDNQTIANLLAELNIQAERGAAVAVNNIVITKSEWDGYTLKQNDKVTVIRATQGG